MADEPVVSFMERSGDDPKFSEMALDMEIETIGTSMGVAERIPEGIEIELAEDGGATVDFDSE